MKINEIAHASGVSADTIRYYEKIGLLPKPKRLQSGYRIYDEKMIENLKLISHAKALGFTLSEVKDLAHMFTNNRLGTREMGQRLKKKLREIDKKIEALVSLKAHISSIVNGECDFKDKLSLNRNTN